MLLHVAALADMREWWLLDGVKEESSDKQLRTEWDLSLPKVSSRTQLCWRVALCKHFLGAAPRVLKAVRREGGTAELSKTQLRRGRRSVACLVPRVPWWGSCFFPPGEKNGG